jgi:CRP-like cAMP-binding protein
MEKIPSFDIGKFYFKNGGLLQRLTQKDKKTLEENSLKITEKKKEIIFEQDTFSKGFYLLLKGKVMIYHTNQVGVQNIIYIYSENEAFGYRPLFNGEKHPVTAQVLEDCVLYFIPKQQFLTLLKKSVNISNIMLQILSYEFNVWINRISAFSQKSVKERLSLALIILNEIYKKDENDKEPSIILSRQNIAKFIGTSLETLVRMLKYFKDENIVELRGKEIIITDYPRLIKIAEHY